MPYNQVTFIVFNNKKSLLSFNIDIQISLLHKIRYIYIANHFKFIDNFHIQTYILFIIQSAHSLANRRSLQKNIVIFYLSTVLGIRLCYVVVQTNIYVFQQNMLRTLYNTQCSLEPHV